MKDFERPFKKIGTLFPLGWIVCKEKFFLQPAKHEQEDSKEVDVARAHCR